MGAGLGLLLHAAPVLHQFDLPSGQGLAATLASWVPFNGGTGFFINEGGLFVSAYHVIGDCPRPAVETPDGLLPGTPVASSAELDITVIRTEAARQSFARFPDYPARSLLDPVIVPRFRGCGGLASWTVTSAVATSMFGRSGAGLALRVRKPIENGNSGSPVVDASGAVIGMLVAHLQEESETGIAVEAGVITRFLADEGILFRTTPTLMTARPENHGVAAGQYTFPVVCLL